MAAARHNVPVRIAHSHSANQDKNLKYPIKLWYKRAIPKYATCLFACGKDAGDWMFGGVPYQIINNAIDAAAYAYDTAKRADVRQALGLGDELVVGHVGRFNQPKNHPFLLEIFAALLKKEPDSVLLLVGGGEDMPKMQAKAKTLGIAEHVRFLGVRSDVAELMQAMDVFVFPSLYEGLPVTMVEAQAASLPCIISDKDSAGVHPDGRSGGCHAAVVSAGRLGGRRFSKSEIFHAPIAVPRLPHTALISTPRR